MPEHFAADEKHSRSKGKKVYIATTVGSQCILGVFVSEEASETVLEKVYGKFRLEALDLNPEYSPTSVNTDGWKATMKVWTSLFPLIFVICCFLHVFIKIRDRSSKKYKELFDVVGNKIWNCYEAATKSSFSQRVRRVYEWAKAIKDVPDIILKPIENLKKTFHLIRGLTICQDATEPATW